VKRFKNTNELYIKQKQQAYFPERVMLGSINPYISSGYGSERGLGTIENDRVKLSLPTRL